MDDASSFDGHLTMSSQLGIRKLEKLNRLPFEAVDSIVEISDQVLVHDSCGTSQGDGRDTTAVRWLDEHAVSSSSDLEPDGSVTYAMTGRPPQNEAGSSEAAYALVSRLNSDGANWGNPIELPQDQGRDIDCEARDGNRLLKMQVTRVMYSDDGYRMLGSTGRMSGCALTGEQLAQQIRKSIQKKAKKISHPQRKALTLVIDALDAPGFVLSSVIREFDGLYGSWSRELGFESIWIVSRFPELTTKLDK